MKQRLWVSMALTGLLLAGPASAGDITWIAPAPASASWHDAANWTSASAPTATDDAIIDNGGTAQIAADATSNNLRIGVAPGGVGTVTQTGGMNAVQNAVFIGQTGTSPGGRGSSGIYNLKGGALSAATEYVGYAGLGTFNHTGGTNNTTNLYLAFALGGRGIYNLVGSGPLSLRVANQYIGYKGIGTFNQSGADNAAEVIYVGYDVRPESHGLFSLYTMHGSSPVTLGSDRLYVGYSGFGQFHQAAGTNATGDLYIGFKTVSPGFRTSGNGTYLLQGSGPVSLGAEREYIGYAATGTFDQSGGTNATGAMYIGFFNHASTVSDPTEGTYKISGGTLLVEELNVGTGATGRFQITNAAASVTVSRFLKVGAHGSISAVAGSVIHMTGSDFINESTNAAALAGLGSLEMIFEGGLGVTDLFEVAGLPGGGFLATGGFSGNFTLGTLTLGGVDVGHLQLVDLFDNQVSGLLGDESLQLLNLQIGSGSSLDVNGLGLFVLGDQKSVLDGWIGSAMLFDTALAGGLQINAIYDAQNNWTTLETVQAPPIPEPGTLALVGLGLLGLGKKLRRRRAA